MINGEPGSALKARGSEWRAQIKVEQGETRDGGRRGERRTRSPITVSVAVPGRQHGGGGGGGVVLGGDSGASLG